MSDLSEPTPATLALAEDFRRLLGTLPPQQVAIWREMTPARKLQLLFQLRSFALKVAWTTKRQWHPDLSPEDLSRRVWRRIMMLCGDIAQRSFWEKAAKICRSDPLGAEAKCWQGNFLDKVV